MKTKLIMASFMAFVLPVFGAFEEWSNKEGKSVILDLVSVSGEGNEIAGVFLMKNGKKVTIKRADLSEESAKLFDLRKPAPPAPKSKFDEALKDNLVILDGEKFKDHTPKNKPAKYYLFYYTASWCPYCIKFTPELIKFYNENKNDNFEIVLVTRDEDKKAMESYAAKSKMPWPQIKLSESQPFQKKFNHGVKSIPSVVVCDLEGKVITNNGGYMPYLKDLVK